MDEETFSDNFVIPCEREEDPEDKDTETRRDSKHESKEDVKPKSKKNMFMIQTIQFICVFLPF